MPPKDYYLPTRQLVSQQEHAMIERPAMPRSRFTNEWQHLTTFDASDLIPFIVDEVLPGDHLKYDITAYLRMSTPLFPILSNLKVYTFLFFCPSRILWTNFVKMMGEQFSPTDTINYTVPQIVSPVGGFLPNSIYDHMGIPVAGQIDPAETMSINALPLRAYNRIWNAWFRDENIQNGRFQTTNDGPDAENNYIILQRNKAHDYFTSALPWPQKFTAPTVPVSGQAPVTGLGFLLSGLSGLNTNFYQTGGPTSGNPKISTIGASGENPAGQDFAIQQDPITGYPLVFADLSQATGVTINTLRQAWMIQQLLERDARGGTRYKEIIKNHFGVNIPDERLQRPEYIGGGASPINITPIAQTAPTTGVPLGALGGTGTGIAQGHKASYAATEHGYIIGLINVRSELSYSQGMHRLWSRLGRYDFYWPALAGLGEQSVLRKEIFMTGIALDDDTVFGYQARWEEYRQNYSQVTAMFRPTTTNNIAQWHLSEEFGTAPALNSTFIQDQTDTILQRVLAAGATANTMEFLADILIRRDAVRPVPLYGTPATLGRF